MIAMNMFGGISSLPHERLSNREFDVMLLLAQENLQLILENYWILVLKQSVPTGLVFWIN